MLSHPFHYHDGLYFGIILYEIHEHRKVVLYLFSGIFLRPTRLVRIFLVVSNGYVDG